MTESFSSATGVPTLTQTVTECWVYSVSNDITYSTPAVPQATGVQCFKIYPTNGGTFMTPIPASEAMPSSTTTLPASTSTSGSDSSQAVQHSMVGAIVGSVVGILVLAAVLLWFMLSRDRRRKRQAEKHQWAMSPGKWVPHEPERKSGPSSAPRTQHVVEDESGPSS